MIKRRKGGRPAKKFKRERLESLPDWTSMLGLSKHLRVSVGSIFFWIRIGGMPYSRLNKYADMTMQREDVIQWMHQTGRVYAEEWVEDKLV